MEVMYMDQISFRYTIALDKRKFIIFSFGTKNIITVEQCCLSAYSDILGCAVNMNGDFKCSNRKRL